MTHCVACGQTARWTVKSPGLPGMPWPEVPVCGEHTPYGTAATALVYLTCNGVPYQPGETIPARALQEVDPEPTTPPTRTPWWDPFPSARFDRCPVRGYSTSGDALLAITGGVRVWRTPEGPLRYERRAPGGGGPFNAGYTVISVHDLTSYECAALTLWTMDHGYTRPVPLPIADIDRMELVNAGCISTWVPR